MLLNVQEKKVERESRRGVLEMWVQIDYEVELWWTSNNCINWGKIISYNLTIPDDLWPPSQAFLSRIGMRDFLGSVLTSG